MSAKPQTEKPHGSFLRYAVGEKVERQHEVASVAAVVSGRLRLVINNETHLLRASDSATIPARAQYELEALDESVVYHYSESGKDDLWGV
jgi:mannose-6-phosphate isomerase-like protein (cupin superfamily)